MRSRGLTALLGAGVLIMSAGLISISHSTAGAATSVPSVTFFGAADKSISKATSSTSAAFEVGMRLTIAKPGKITALRFYKRVGNAGPHVGSLWSSTGTRLRSQKFVSESASGWQQVTLDQPLTVTAGQRITVSYSAPIGHYAYSLGYFASSRTRGPLTAPAHAGVYRAGSFGYPSSVPARGANYWVDVVFAPSAPAPSTSSPAPAPSTSSPAPAPSTSSPAPAPAPSTPAVSGSFPTTTSAGWRASGIGALKAYTGPTVITTSGTVIDGADISSDIVVQANNVTIKRSRILSGSADWAVLLQSGYSGLTLSYVEVGPQAGQHPDRAIQSNGTNLTVDHVYVHGTQRGVATGDGTRVTNSYIDDLDNSSGNHATAVMSIGDVRNVVVQGNTLGCGTGECSSAMSVYPQWGPNDNWTIDHNLFNGGSYCVYLGYSPASGESPNTNMRVTNNSFGSKYSANCGIFGAVASWSWSTGNTWTNNTWYTPGVSKNGTAVTP